MPYPRRFFHRATVNVPTSVVWNVFTDHERIGEYTSTPCRITRPGQTDRNGLGCVRIIGTAKRGLPEVEETENYWVANKRFGYHLTSGAPLSHHQGLIRLLELGPRRTEYIYDIRLTALPETFEQIPDYYDQLDASFRQFMKDAECECERRGAEADLFQPPSEPILLSEQGGQLAW